MIYKRYIDNILSGRIVSGEFIRFAIDRHVADLQRQMTDDFPYYFNEKEGERWIKFAHLCHHWKGEWARQPVLLEPHQQFYFMLLFGWQRTAGGRRFRTSYKEIARKNGKTTECAIKALGHLVLDKEPGAQVYFAATKEEQARIGFNDVKEIIRVSPLLQGRFRGYVKSIVSGNSSIRPLGSDSDTQDGFDPSYGIIDEYHAHPTSGMLNVLESGMGSRRSPLIDIITTAGFNRTGPCYTEARNTSIEILRGIKTDDTHLAIIYTLDKDDNWSDSDCWVKSNPNIDVSVKRSFLIDRFTKARNEGGSKEVDFKTKNLNLWTDTERTWIPDDVWMKCSENLDLRALAGRSCVAGLDLASKRDTTALVLLFPVGELLLVLPFIFLPNLTAKERVEKDGVNYDRWIRDGHIIETPGNVTDYSYIRRKLNELRETYDIRSIAYDRWNSSQLIIDLQGDGFKCNPFGQGFASMSAPTKELEGFVYSKRIVHGGNPVLRWMCSNVMIVSDAAGNMKINKEKSREKVDGIVALVMAIGEYISGFDKDVSVYDQHGIRSF